MTNSRAIVPLAAFVALCGLSACGTDTPAGEQTEARLHFWTKTGNETCTRMQGQAYCFPVKNIDAHSLPTDSGAGFLLLVPVENDAVVECNQRHYSLDDHFAYPHIQASVGEVSYEDTPQAYAQRLRENRLGQTNSDLERPLQRFGIYGLDCYRYRSDAVYRNDAMCTGGTGGAPVFYLSCSKDGSLPNPSCQDEFVYNGLVYRISYNKRCQPHHDVIRQWIIRFVDEGRSRAAQ